MAREEDTGWLVQLHEEHRATLHRLAVLLGAEPQSGRIIRNAMLAIFRRGNRLIDPAERVEAAQEQVVHNSRAARPAGAQITLPDVPDERQSEILAAISTLPVRGAEVVIVSHYLGTFGPELAGIMRMSVRTANRLLESSLEDIRAVVGDPTPGSVPGVIESLSQEITAALRSAGRQVQPPGTDTLELELADLQGNDGHRIRTAVVALVTGLALALGLLLAAITRPSYSAVETPTAEPSVEPTAMASHLIPAQARSIPLYFVGREGGALYRELRSLPATRNLVASASEALLTLVPADPDYESAWEGGQVLSAEVSGGTLTLDLSADAYSGIDSPVLAQRARDQVIYTASEIIGNPDLRVVFLSAGEAPPEGFVSENGFGRTDLEPLPSVWISSHRNAAELVEGPLLISGAVKPDLGAPIVTITNTVTGAVVTDVSAQTSTGVNSAGWQVWSVAVTLPPGTYDVKASITSGTPPVASADNKILTIKPA